VPRLHDENNAALRHVPALDSQSHQFPTVIIEED
jgi:hypothetical protein